MTRRRRSNHKRSSIAPLLLGTVAVAAGGAFALLSRASARQQTKDVDRALHRKLTPPADHPVRTLGDVLAPMGKWYAYVPAALVVAQSMLRAEEPRRQRQQTRRSRRGGAAAVTASGLASFALTELFDKVLPQPPSPPGQPEGRPVFPSGHTFGPLAVGLASAYVLGRERLASPAISLPIALTLPLVSAGTRIVKEKHWGSDVAGGVVGGIAVAGAVLAAWELMRER